MNLEDLTGKTLGGYEILRDSPSEYLQMGATIAWCHHERFDGGGYPRGLSGEDIHIFGRIVAIVDVFDALTSVRPYKGAWPLEQALDLLHEESGATFDSACVDAFMHNLAEVRRIMGELPDLQNGTRP